MSLSTPNLDQYWINPSTHPLSQVRGVDWWREPNALFPWTLAQIPFFPDDGYSLLDVGCGTGTNAIAAAKLGWQVDAFDGSASTVEYAQTFAREQWVASQIRFFVNYFLDFPYPEGKYAGVFSFNALHHDTEESMRESIEKVYKSLVPWGKLFVTLPLLSTRENYGDQIAMHTFLPNSWHEKWVPHVLFDDVFVEDMFGKYFNIERDKDGNFPFADSRHYFLSMTKQ